MLDTWFSSALWPFSTMGWPDDTPDCRKYYPTSLLVTGVRHSFLLGCSHDHDGPEFTGTSSLQTGLDAFNRPQCRRPEDVEVERHRHGPHRNESKNSGPTQCDFTLASMAAPGTDIVLTEDRILSYRAFANKIWNAARFVFMNLDKYETSGGETLEALAAPEVRSSAPYAVEGQVALVDRWIFSRLARATAQVNDALEHFRFHEAAHVVYHFFWGDFCDWYIEWVKPELTGTDRVKATATWKNLFAAFESALRLLHPFMPFLTEELWHQLPQRRRRKIHRARPLPRASYRAHRCRC